MKRVNKGEKFWRIWAMDIRFEICESIDDYGSICTQMYEMGNYFHTQKEAEAMVKKIRAVLQGTDVIKVDEEKLDKLAQKAYPFEDDDAHWNNYQRLRQRAYKEGYWLARKELGLPKCD